MIINVGRESIIFEDERFDGKSVLVTSELYPYCFLMNERDMYWMEINPETQKYRKTPIDDEKISELLPYIKSEAEKMNFPLIPWETR